MEPLPPQRIVPGVTGYSDQPISPNEAMVQNMEIERDGVWRARLGWDLMNLLSESPEFLSACPPLHASMAVYIGNGKAFRIDSSGVETQFSSYGTGWSPFVYFKAAWGEKAP